MTNPIRPDSDFPGASMRPMVPDKDGAYYHREHGVCLVDVEWNLVWDITGGYPHDLDKSSPADWLGPVPTAEEWAKAQDHPGEPNDMTLELAEALENCVSLLEHATCESGVCMCGSPPRQHKLGCEEHGFVDSGTYNQGLIIPAARAVLEKYRATRKEQGE